MAPIVGQREDRLAEEPPEPNAPAFFGRVEALEALEGASHGEERVIVVGGPAGVGKSRLVERWVAGCGRSCARADLGAARDLEDGLRRIGRALALDFAPGQGPRDVVSRVAHVLTSRAPALLWLDDADALVEPLGAVLERLRVMAPEALFVLTSRRARLGGTHVAVQVAPLVHDEAVALLVDRARRVRPDFSISAAQRSSVDALVRRSDALPLAIELLAPRLRLLSPARLAARLVERAGPADALRHALDRSFELLTAAERVVLAQCTVFRDGFYLDAAEAVADLTEHPGAPDVLTVLESLVDQSLLRTESVPELPDEVRLRFFGAVRDRARSELDGPLLEAARARHGAWFASAAEVWDAGIESPDEVAHTARLIVELPNLEAAFEHAEGRDEARLGLVLHMAYQRRGPFGRQRELVYGVRELATRLADDELLAKAELASARVARWADDLDAADAALRRALAAARRADSAELEAGCARNLAAGRYRAGDMEGFQANLDHALEAAGRSGRASDEVNARNGLGFLYAKLGQTESAREQLEQASRLAEATGIPGLIALTHASLSSMMLGAERLEAAERHSSAAIRAYEALGYLRQWCLEHLVRAEVRLWADDLAGAHEDAAAALDRARWLGLEGPLARALVLRGKVAFCEQDFGGARDALEDAVARRPDDGAVWGYVGAARAMMGHLEAADEAFAKAGDTEVATALRSFAALGQAKAGGKRRPAVAAAALLEAGSLEARHIVELRASVARAIRPPSQASAVRLEVTPGARWFRLEGDPGVDLTRRRALRGVLEGFVAKRLSTPGEAMTLETVLEAGWPGERMSPESASRRVYVTINRLRKLGLGEYLLTTGDGYMLAPRLEIIELTTPAA